MSAFAEETLRNNVGEVTLREVGSPGSFGEPQRPIIPAHTVVPEDRWLRPSLWRTLLHAVRLFGITAIPVAAVFLWSVVTHLESAMLRGTLVQCAMGVLGLWLVLGILALLRWSLDRHTTWKVSKSGIAIYHRTRLVQFVGWGVTASLKATPFHVVLSTAVGSGEELKWLSSPEKRWLEQIWRTQHPARQSGVQGGGTHGRDASNAAALKD